VGRWGSCWVAVQLLGAQHGVTAEVEAPVQLLALLLWCNSNLQSVRRNTLSGLRWQLRLAACHPQGFQTAPPQRPLDAFLAPAAQPVIQVVVTPPALMGRTAGYPVAVRHVVPLMVAMIRLSLKRLVLWLVGPSSRPSGLAMSLT